MTPTCYLRFIDEEKEKPVQEVLRMPTLQQWWHDRAGGLLDGSNPTPYPGEWRDVPVYEGEPDFS